MHLILGSQSPRRKEILGYFSIPFEQIAPDFDERSIPFSGDPQQYVKDLSVGKAASLSSQYPHSVIVTADTIVYYNGKIYGKPKDELDAYRMLSELSGQWHTVFTGVSVVKGGQTFTGVEDTRVLFNRVSPEQIRHYFNSLHCLDKAGSYFIQTAGGLIVKRIEGCYYNVMGLPINILRTLLEKVGIELWNFLR